jgi:hypothetical protein
MAGDVVDDLSAAGGVTDVDGVLQNEVLREGGEVIGVMVHVVAIAGLSRAPVSAPVVGDDPVAMLQEEQQLRIPVID